MFALLMHFLLFLLPISSAVASPTAQAAYPDPEPCTGDIEDRTHDPSVVRRDDGTFFLFGTHNGVNIATAKCMSGPWKHEGSALPNGSIIDLPGNTDLWAPDVSKVGDTYYLFYAVSTFGSQDSEIGVATSSSMDVDSWTDHGSIGIPFDARYNRIDPNLFQHDHELLLSFGSFWQDIFQVKMNNPPVSIKAGTDVTHLEYNTTVPSPTEGAYLFQKRMHGVNYHYLFFSSGACCDLPPNLPTPGNEYKVMVCRSTRPDSGFVDKAGTDCLTANGGSAILASHGDVYAPGGQGVIYDPEQRSTVLYYHYLKPSKNYTTVFGWNRLDFASGWPVVV